MAVVARKKRGTESVSDMVRSLGLVLGFVVVLVAIGAPQLLMHKRAPVHVVDIRADVAAARAAATYPVLAPVGLPARWRPTSSRVLGSGAVGLHIGYVTPTDSYAQLEETSLGGFVTQSVGKGATALPEVDVAGQTWQQWRAGNKDLVLARQDGNRAVVVRGTADTAELRTLITSLRAG